FRNSYGLSSLEVDLEGHGREEVLANMNVSRTVGWFTSIYPVRLEATDVPLSILIRQVKETLRSIPHHGMDYLLQPRSGALRRSAVSFNYLGQFDTDTRWPSFSVLNEYKGGEMSLDGSWHYEWDIAGQVQNGKLALSLRYSKAQYRQDSIRHFMAHYKAALQEIIRYCQDYGKVVLSPSDTGCPDLTMAALDSLQETFLVENIYPLSPMQEGLLFHTLYDASADHYFEQVSCRITGQLEVEDVVGAMNTLLSRYDILRTVYLYEGY
ncbi:condensation domain-containing protein, partial [Chitinophaga varians]|uniref:condensation domain-containing protein n=1 Tax=Chitinophaga varians TaxID=2202339 RepID=UPI0019C82A66